MREEYEFLRGERGDLREKNEIVRVIKESLRERVTNKRTHTVEVPI